jgi:hypothetical protein
MPNAAERSSSSLAVKYAKSAVSATASMGKSIAR